MKQTNKRTDATSECNDVYRATELN